MTDSTGQEARDYDVCKCGDYRVQHVDGVGRCKLRDLCTPAGCLKFRLYQIEQPARRGEYRP